MNLIDFKSGGQPFFNRDFAFQQSEIMKAIEGQYEGLGAFVVSGCEVSGGSNIAPGLVYISGKLQEFTGATSVTFPIYIKAATPVQYEERFFAEDNQNKTTRVNYHAEYTATEPPGGEYITINATGASKKLSLHIGDAGNPLDTRLNNLEDTTKPISLDSTDTAIRLFGSVITDLNQVNKPGNFLLHTNGTPAIANAPVVGFTVIQNVGGDFGGNMFQYLRVRHSEIIYHRELDYNSVWRAWYKIASTPA